MTVIECYSISAIQIHYHFFPSVGDVVEDLSAFGLPESEYILILIRECDCSTTATYVFLLFSDLVLIALYWKRKLGAATHFSEIIKQHYC